MVEGLLGRKVGMSQVFNDEGECVPVTLIEVGPCTVLESIEVNGQRRVRVGYIECKEKKVKKPQRGYFKKLGFSTCYRFIKEVPVVDDVEVKTGDTLTVDIFKDVSIVDVRGRTKGRGFTGGMKRWNMAGQPRSHGHTIHRKIGSVGGTTEPARVFKGKRMPGHYGLSLIHI